MAYRKINVSSWIQNVSKRRKGQRNTGEERNKIPYKYLKTEGKLLMRRYHITRKGKDHNKYRQRSKTWRTNSQQRSNDFIELFRK